MNSCLLTEEEAAKFLRMSPRTLRELRRTRAIHYVALSARKIAYRIEDCEEYIASRVRLDSAERTDDRASRGKGRRGRKRSVAPRHDNIVPFSQRQRA